MLLSTLALACAAGVVSDAAVRPGRPVAGAPVAGTIGAGTPGAEMATVDALSLHSTSGSTAGEAGYTTLQPTLIGQTPSGFTVWVDRRAPHHSTIARNAAQAVSDLRHMATKVTWRGYGAPAAAEGVVRVREGAQGCGHDGGTVGMTWTYWHTLSSGRRYASRADVYLCPRLFRLGAWAVGATVRHELGHAMGLGHTNYKYDGSYQVMNASVRRGVVHYRAGDRRGLATLARNTAWVKTQIPPDGHLDGSTWHDDGTIHFTGWALLRYYRTSPVTIVLTDNGTAIQSGGTPVLRPDVNRAKDPGSRPHGFDLSVPWPGGTHEYCVTARSTDRPSASVRLGCVTWRG
jgi:hypothetical protein